MSVGSHTSSLSVGNIVSNPNSDSTLNPDITEMKVVVDGIPDKIYSQGMKTRDMWEEVFRRFGKENSAKKATEFYAGDRFSLFIDLKSVRDNDPHGSGLRLVDTKEGSPGKSSLMLSSSS